jgi:hypothetical protein
MTAWIRNDQSMIVDQDLDSNFLTDGSTFQSALPPITESSKIETTNPSQSC